MISLYQLVISVIFYFIQKHFSLKLTVPFADYILCYLDLFYRGWFTREREYEQSRN
jgi:hypothetical protein